LRENGVIMKNSGVFNKTVENIGLKQEKRVGSENWALVGRSCSKIWVMSLAQAD